MDGIQKYELIDGRFFQPFDGGPAEHAVGAARIDARRTRVLERLRALADGAGGVDHIVDHQAFLILDVADDAHDLHDVGLGTPLIDDGEGHAEGFGDLTGTLDAAHVRRNDAFHVPLRGEIVHQNGRTVQVVHGNIEKSLNLIGVQVHGEDPVGARPREQVCHEFGGDGITRTRFSVLTGIAEIGHNGRHAARAGALHGVDHDEQFHQAVIDRLCSGLNEEDVSTAHGLFDVTIDLAVGEGVQLYIPEPHAQFFCDFFREGSVRVAGEELDFLEIRDHFRISPSLNFYLLVSHLSRFFIILHSVRSVNRFMRKQSLIDKNPLKPVFPPLTQSARCIACPTRDFQGALSLERGS